MKMLLIICALSLLLSACHQSAAPVKIDPQHYQVQTASALQQRFNDLNAQLEQDFLAFKKREINAFAHQFPLDSANLLSLNQHLVASTALKPTKLAYCELMNRYFADFYHLGHHNLSLVDQIQLPNTQAEHLNQVFANKEAFYTIILDRYTSYRQVQQTMGYGCNLKAAL